MSLECVHHWLIQDANGPTSMGICQLCGLVKEFTNSIAEGVDAWTAKLPREVMTARAKTRRDEARGKAIY